MSNGCVYLVGAGPGDPGLLTLRGKEVLSTADAVVYDHLAAARLLEFAPAAAERIYVGKQAAAHTMKQEEINALLVRLGREGKQVVRLKGGDPFVFGRGGEEALALAEAGVAFEVVCGVTAGIAAAAYAGIPVTHRGLAGAFAMITAHEAPGKDAPDLDYTALAKFPGTLAFFMGVANLEIICRRLIECGLDAATPAAIIRWGTTSRQQTVVGTAADLPGLALAADIGPPALIVVGKTVGLREKLNWFEKRPLLGRRMVVTRSRQQASGLSARLERLGAEVVELPMIRREAPADPAELERAAAGAGEFDWLVFTSANAVEAFFAALRRAGRDSRALGAVKVCVVGPATAARLEAFGIRADAMPAKHEGAAIGEALAARDALAGRRVLYPKGDLADSRLAEALVGHGAAVTEVIAYRTVVEEASGAAAFVLPAEGAIHWVIFTSSSTVENFLSVTPPGTLASCGARLASIGPRTSAALRKHGLAPTVEAKSHTIPGLIEAILDVERCGAARP